MIITWTFYLPHSCYFHFKCYTFTMNFFECDPNVTISSSKNRYYVNPLSVIKIGFQFSYKYCTKIHLSLVQDRCLRTYDILYQGKGLS